MVYTPFYRRTFALATVLILGYLLWRLLHPLASTLGWAAMLAFMLHPLHEKLTRRLQGRATWSAGILTGLTPFFVLAPLTFLGAMFTAQTLALINYLRTRTWMPYSELVDRAAHLPLLGTLVRWVRENAIISVDQLQRWINDSTQSLLRSAAAMGGSLVVGVFGTVVSFFVMLFLLFFFLREGRTILTHLTRLIPLEPSTRSRMMVYLGDVVRAVVFGSTATALICGAFVGVAYGVLDLPSPLVFGVLGVIAALLPAGAAVLLVPPLIYLLIQGRLGMAILLAIWTTAMWVVESVVRPMLTAHRADVSTLAVFLGAIGGVSAYGLLGLVAGPVLLSFVVALLLFAEATISREHQLSAASSRLQNAPPPPRQPPAGSAEQTARLTTAAGPDQSSEGPGAKAEQ